MTEWIYHIVTASELKRGTAVGYYAPDRLPLDGFVHCTATPALLLTVARDYFSTVTESVLVLTLDPELLEHEVKYEAAAPIKGGGREHLADAPLFPHVYGKINLTAVTGTAVLQRDGDQFLWPDEFQPIEMFL